MRGKHTTPPAGATHSRAGSPAIHRVDDLAVGVDAGPDAGQQLVAAAHHLEGDLLVDQRVADDHLLLGRQERARCSVGSVVMTQPMRMPGMP